MLNCSSKFIGQHMPWIVLAVILIVTTPVKAGFFDDLKEVVKESTREVGKVFSGARGSSGTRNDPLPNEGADNTDNLSSDQVRRIQSQLNQLGYGAGALDGFPGRKTRTATAEFRADRNLPGGDVLDGQLLIELAQSLGLPAEAGSTEEGRSPPSVRAKTAGQPQVERSRIEAAVRDGELVARPLEERLRQISGSVLLLGGGSRTQAMREYGMLLGLKLNPSGYSKFVTQRGGMGRGYSRALCVANELAETSSQDDYLSERPSVSAAYQSGRSGKNGMLRYWRGENEFAQRRTSERFIKSTLPDIIGAAKNIPLKVAFETALALGQYDFENQGFKVLSRPAFSRKWSLANSNVSLPAICGSHARLAPDTAYVEIGEYLSMSPEKAEAFTDNVRQAVGGRSSSRIILRQVTYANLRIATDKNGRRRYRAEPTHAELYADKKLTTRVVQLTTNGRSTSGDTSAARQPIATRTSGATAPTKKVSEVEQAPKSPTQSVTRKPTKPVPSANAAAGDGSPTLSNPNLRRFDNDPMLPGISVKSVMNFGQPSQQALSSYINWLAVAGWVEQGGEVSTDQKDRISNKVALCAANDLLPPEKRMPYIGKQATTRKNQARFSRNWSGADQFSQRRTRVEFVQNEWPAMKRALPALPATFSLISRFTLEDYDFKRKGFALEAPSATWFSAGRPCAFDVRVAVSINKLPDFLPLAPDKAEQLLEQISQARPDSNNSLYNDSNKLFAAIKAQAMPINITSGISLEATLQFQPVRLELFVDADMTQRVHMWDIASPARSANARLKRPVLPTTGSIRQPAAPLANENSPSTGNRDSQAVAGISQLLNHRHLFNDAALATALRARGDTLISWPAVRMMMRDQHKLDTLYYGQRILRYQTNGVVRRVALPEYEPDVEPYFMKGERANTDDKNNVEALKKYMNWRLARSAAWPRTANVLVQLRAPESRLAGHRMSLDLVRWKQIQSNDSVVKYLSSSIEEVLTARGISPSRVFLPHLNIDSREPYRSRLFRLDDKRRVPLFVLPWNYEEIRLPFEPKPLAGKVGARFSSLPAELELELQSLDLIPVNKNTELLIVKVQPLELRVPTADMSAVAAVHDFRHGPAGDPALLKKTFTDRRLEVLGVSLGMTLGESVAAIRVKMDGLDISDIKIDQLHRFSGSSARACSGKWGSVQRQVQTKRSRIIRDQRIVCQETARSDAQARMACIKSANTLPPAGEQELTKLKHSLTAALPSECTLINEPFVAYAGFEVNYGAGLKDRIVLYGEGGANDDSKLVALTRVFTDKSDSVDFLAKLNKAFGGNAYRRSSQKVAHWFESADFHDQVVARKKIRNQCGIGGGIGINSLGQISRRFVRPCSRYVAYYKSKHTHNVLLVDTEKAGRFSVQRAIDSKEEIKKAQSKVKF